MSTSLPIADLTIRFAGETHTGMKRNHNEDCLFLPNSDPLLVVADGMGGHACGDVASQLAIDTIVDHFTKTANDQATSWPFMVDEEEVRQGNRLVTAIKLANLEIFEKAQRDSNHRGMGTTVVAGIFCEKTLLMGHVGDSRIYRVRNGEIVQLTEDHSLLNDYIKMKRIDPADADNFPHHNVIVRALGMKANVAVDLIRDTFESGDIYLLCSDGLSGMLTDDDILGVMQGVTSLDQACEELISQANQNGGVDNVTVALARIEA